MFLVPIEYQRRGKTANRAADSARAAITRRHARRTNYLHRRAISAGDPAGCVTRGGVSHAKPADRITGEPRETEKKDYVSNSDLWRRDRPSRFRENDATISRALASTCVRARACVAPTIAFIDAGNEQVERHFLVPTERGRSRVAVCRPIAHLSAKADRKLIQPA